MCDPDVTWMTWCADIEYPNLGQFRVGTLRIRHGAPMHVVESDMAKLIVSILPPGWVLRNLIPGALIFAPQEET